LKDRTLIALLAFCLLAAPSVFAAQLTGTVTNGTTNKPSVGDEVTLLALSSGMDEVAHTKTDSQGHFSFDIPDDNAQHLLRVTRQSVGYFKAIPPGATSADITVYDAATQLDNITTTARVFHFQAGSGNLDVNDMYVLSNQSQPPRSRIGNQTFFITLPVGARIGEASTTGPSGMPITVNPVPSGVKNQYAFDFPVRPGETRFEVNYQLPYIGQYDFSFTPGTPLGELGVLLPKSMKLTDASSEFAQDRDEGNLSVFFLKNVGANQPVSFRISGEGMASEGPQEGTGGEAPQPSTNNPATSHFSISSYWIAGIIVLIAGVGFLLWRKATASSNPPDNKTRSGQRRANVQTASDGSDLVDALKDELFQLESDRLSGKISAEEYEKTKAGLDTLMRRQMKR
jgi:hypothetical protein